MHQAINAGGFCVGCDRAQQERDESVAYEATYIAPSGTALARDDGMLYESPALGETKRLRKINDGIISSQNRPYSRSTILPVNGAAGRFGA